MLPLLRIAIEHYSRHIFPSTLLFPEIAQSVVVHDRFRSILLLYAITASYAHFLYEIPRGVGIDFQMDTQAVQHVRPVLTYRGATFLTLGD